MVVAAIAAVVHVVLNGPDQPPTIRKQPSRAKDRARRRPVKPAIEAAAPERVTTSPPSRPVGVLPVTPAFAGPDSDIMRLRALPARHNSVWVRIRSAVALIVMVAVLGAMLALAIGGLMLGLALLVRSATG